MERLARRLGCPYLGTIIRSGAETTSQVLPGVMAKAIKLWMKSGMRALGKGFGRTGRLDPVLVGRLAFPENLPAWAVSFFRIYSRIGIRYIGFDRS